MLNRKNAVPTKYTTPPTEQQVSAAQRVSVPSTSLTIKRLAAVKAQVGLSRSTIYAYIKQGLFPRPIHLGGNSVGWLASEIQLWLNERVIHRDQTHLPN